MEQAQPVQQHFNGVITYDDQKFEVMSGICIVDGEQFFVSDDGKFVLDKNQGLVGIIQGGELFELTPEIEDQLRQEGVIE